MKDIEIIVDSKAKEIKNRLEKNIEIISRLNPLEVLKSGYALAEQNGKKLTSVNEIGVGDEFTLSLYDGKLLAEVKLKGESDDI